MCGIAAFLGYKIDNPYLFDLTGFLGLFQAQDKRGGDSCGIFFKCEDAETKKSKVKVLWGSKDDTLNNSKVETFINNRSKELLDSNLTHPYLLVGHARKATSGTANRDNAHPFFWKDVIGVHNGTLEDWRHFIGEHLGVDLEGVENDSEALIRALGEGKAEQFFTEYNGNAAVIWYNRAEDATYIWCGQSQGKEYSYSTYITDRVERPLHMWQTVAGVYITSEDTPLKQFAALKPSNYGTDPVVQIKTNTIYKLVDGYCVEDTTIVRKPYKRPVEKKEVSNPPTSTFRTVDTNITTGIATVPNNGNFAKLTNWDYLNKTSSGLFGKSVSVFNGLYCRQHTVAHSGIINDLFVNIPDGFKFFQGLLVEANKYDELLKLVESNTNYTSYEISALAASPVPLGYSEVLKQNRGDVLRGMSLPLKVFNITSNYFVQHGQHMNGEKLIKYLSQTQTYYQFNKGAIVEEIYNK